MAEGGSGNLRPGASRSKRKGRSRRGKKTNHRIQLSQEDIEYLKLNTKFDEQEIREWFKGFKVIEKTCLKSFSAFKCNVGNEKPPHMTQVRAATVDFWQARMPWWRPLHWRAPTVAAVYYFSKSSQRPSLVCLGSLGELQKLSNF